MGEKKMGENEKTLRQLVLRRRVELHVSQAGFGELAGLPYSLIAGLEQGRRRYMRAGEINQLARALGMPEMTLWEYLLLDREAMAGKRYVRVAQ